MWTASVGGPARPNGGTSSFVSAERERKYAAEAPLDRAAARERWPYIFTGDA